MTYSRPPGKTTAEMQAEHRAFMDSADTITVCVFCGWSHVGTALEGREAAATHRAGEHPLIKLKRRKKKSRNNLARVQSDAESRAQSQVEVDWRKSRAEGDEAA